MQLLAAKTARPVGCDGTYGEMATPAGLKEIARYADGVGPSKDYIVPRDATGRSLAPTTFVKDAHKAGLRRPPVHVPQREHVPAAGTAQLPDPAAYGNAIAEYEQFFALGVDGMFSDNSDTAVEAREDYRRRRRSDRPARPTGAGGRRAARAARRRRGSRRQPRSVRTSGSSSPRRAATTIGARSARAAISS